MLGKYIGLGLGAGLVSALLFAVVTTGSPPGVFLSYAAPLPIVIVALGWNHLLGLLGVAAGALALSFGMSSSSGTAFAVGAALPAWLLSYLVLLPAGRADVTAGGGRISLGTVLLAAAILGGAVVLAGALAIGGGDYAVYRTVLVRFAEAFLRVYGGVPEASAVPSIAGLSGSSVAAFIADLTPVLLGVVLTIVLALNLWAGGRIVALSGRLPQPWVPVREARMPPVSLVLLLGAVLCAFAGGFVAVAGRGLLGALGAAMALQGFGLLHDVTRGRPARGAVLSFAYVLTAVAAGPILPLMALAGFADIATPIRRRLTGRPQGPGPRSV